MIRSFRRDPLLIFKLLSFYKVWRKRPALRILREAGVVQKFHLICEARKNGAQRIYNLFLVISQALKFLAHLTKSPVDSTPSWRLISGIQKDYQRAVKSEQNAAHVLPPKFHLLSGEDYATLKEKCQTFLDKSLSWVPKEKRNRGREYMDHLILLTLISVPTPRHQIFAMMEERHLSWKEAEATYHIIFDGSDPPLKNGKPVVLVLPCDLSQYYSVKIFFHIYSLISFRRSGFVFFALCTCQREAGPLLFFPTPLGALLLS